MSISTESSSVLSPTHTSSAVATSVSTLTAPKEGFAEQLLKLREHQELQYRSLLQKYQEQQDVLRQQQQQELQQHYNRQRFLNPNHKESHSYRRPPLIEAPPVAAKSDAVPAEESSRAHRMEDHAAHAPGSSSVISAMVRDRVRKKALDNISKKSTFEMIDARALNARQQDEYKKWVYENNAYGPDEDELFALRKSISEPNLKGRNPFKHRVRYKPTVEHPMQGHPRHGHSPDMRHPDVHADKHDTLSPPYVKPVEGKVFSQGPIGRLLPFQSPSLPNINLDGPVRSVHFPTAMSTAERFPTSLNPDVKAPLQPGHPNYLDMLKLQFDTNHRYLRHLMISHRQDPEEIDLYLARCLPIAESGRMSDEARVKQLLEAQNTLYLHLVNKFGAAPHANLFSGMSKSYSKLHSIESLPPSAALMQSRSHDSIHDIKSPQDFRYPKDELPPHRQPGFHQQSRHFPFARAPVSDNPPFLPKEQTAAARMRLKEHLRDKQDASGSSSHGSISVDSRYIQLSSSSRDKIQEETEEDVAKEEKRVTYPQRIPDDIPNPQRSLFRSRSSEISAPGRSLPSTRSSEMLASRSSEMLASQSSEMVVSRSSDGLGSGAAEPVSTLQSRLSLTSLSSSSIAEPSEEVKVVQRSMTGLVYDSVMLKHQCPCGQSYPVHPESPGRLQSIWARLNETGVADKCARIKPRKATLVEIQTVHSEQHAVLFGGGASSRGSQNLRCFVKIPCGGMGVDADTIWNETHTSNAARTAAGCVIELAFKVANGDLKNGFAIVRPPGHHAETHQAMGFCYFNSVAIAAKLLCMKMAVERVMIIDWDIHHGNGTQQMFYDDDRVLYLSMHRHDDGMFFPGTGKPEECGAGIGVGCNINIAFSGGLDPPYSDPEYLAAFHSIVIPVVKEYKPDIILVSAGFDAAVGHSPQLGGYKVSAATFAYMTRQLMEYAGGKVVLALEGGYVLQSLCDAAENCVRALLGESFAELSDDVKQTMPSNNCRKSLMRVADIQGKYWAGVKRAASQIGSSMLGAKKLEREEADTVSALASLSMGVVKRSDGSVERAGVPSEQMPPLNTSGSSSPEVTSSTTDEPMDEI